MIGAVLQIEYRRGIQTKQTTILNNAEPFPCRTFKMWLHYCNKSATLGCKREFGTDCGYVKTVNVRSHFNCGRNMWCLILSIKQLCKYWNSRKSNIIYLTLRCSEIFFFLNHELEYFVGKLKVKIQCI